MIRYKYWIYYLLLLAGMLMACFASLHLTQHGFAGFDVSPMIDAGWRVFSGQHPGKDFVVTFPASLYLATAMSFRFFGVTWRAIALGECCCYLVMSLLGLRVASLLTDRFGKTSAMVVSACYVGAQTILIVSINYLWHASMAESFGAYAVLVAAAWAVQEEKQRWREAEILLHLSFAFFCLLLSKPNTAYPVILLCAIVLVRAGRDWRALAGVLLVAMTGVFFVLQTAGVTIPRMLAAYVGLNGRWIPKAFFNGILYTLYARYGMANLLVYSILAGLGAKAIQRAFQNRREVGRDPVVLLAVGSIAVSILGMGTNFDFKLTDTPMFLVGLALFSISTRFEVRILQRQALMATAALCLLASYFGVTRFRMQIVGTWADDKCGERVVWRDPFFGEFHSCVVVRDTAGEVDQALNQVGPQKHVFFGPALEFLYARNHVAAPLHLPDWWDAGSSYPKSHEGSISEAWRDDHFDMVVLSHGDLAAPLPPDIIRQIRDNYRLLPGNDKLIDVYVPR